MSTVLQVTNENVNAEWIIKDFFAECTVLDSESFLLYGNTWSCRIYRISPLYLNNSAVYLRSMELSSTDNHVEVTFGVKKADGSLHDSTHIEIIPESFSDDGLLLGKIDRRKLLASQDMLLPGGQLTIRFTFRLVVDASVVGNTASISPDVTIQGFECDVSKVLLSTEQFLARHKNDNPHQGHDRRHKCSIYSYSTSRKEHYENHLRTQTQERPFRCPQCSKTFKQSSLLKTHHLTHAGQKSYNCSVCGKEFTNSCNLRRHEFIHTGQKPHMCPHCEYKAIQIVTLRRHVIAVHTKQYPHVCSDCGKGFMKARDLRQHVSKHNLDKIELDV